MPSAKRRLVLHIGTEKTGTTSIQGALDDNRQELLDAGFYNLRFRGRADNRDLVLSFKNVPDDDWHSENRLRDAFALASYRDALAHEFAAEISAIPSFVGTVIISGEHFHSCLVDISDVDSAKGFFEEFFDQIEVFCYVREQSEVCRALYSTLLKSGTLVDPLDHLRACSVDNAYYDYLSLANRWSSVFGVESFRLFIYQSEIDAHGCVVKSFLSALNAPLKAGQHFTSFSRLNPSVTLTGATLLTALNALRCDDNPILSPDAYARLVPAIERLFAGREPLFPLESMKKIYDAFAIQNETLSSVYLGVESNPFGLGHLLDGYSHSHSARGHLLGLDAAKSAAELLRLLIAIEKEEALSSFRPRLSALRNG